MLRYALILGAGPTPTSRPRPSRPQPSRPPSPLPHARSLLNEKLRHMTNDFGPLYLKKCWKYWQLKKTLRDNNNIWQVLYKRQNNNNNNNNKINLGVKASQTKKNEKMGERNVLYYVFFNHRVVIIYKTIYKKHSTYEL